LPKIWIDILTPKQTLFLNKIGEALEERGFEVLYTTRQYREVVELIKLKKLKAIIVGRHGGKNLSEKLIASSERIIELTKLIIEEKPDMALSFSSPECARVAFGLGIPHISVNDSPHSVFVAKLTIPLSKTLFSPKVIPKEVWTRFGIDKSNILQYNALDPVAWLKDFTPNAQVLHELNLDTDKPIITIRETEAYASYLLQKVDSIAPVSDVLIPLLVKEIEQVQIVVLPRYEEQVNYIQRKYRSRNVSVATKVIDGASLLYYTTVFVGGGGTMNIEAALLGVPVISVYPGETTYVEKFLIKKGLVFRNKRINVVIRKIIDFIKDDNLKMLIKSKAEKLMRKMEDPAKFISTNLVKIMQYT